MDITFSDDGAECVSEPFEKPDKDAKLRWWRESPTEYGYNPYVIQATEDRTDHVLKFRFVHWETAEVLGAGPHTIDLRDTRAVWRDGPSTIHGIKKDQCAILFLRWEGLLKAVTFPDAQPEYDKIRAAALDSGGGTGKWPKSAGTGPHLLSAIRKLTEAIRKPMGIVDGGTQRVLEEILADALQAVD